MAELENVMSSYQLLSDQAMDYAENQFSILEQDRDSELQTIQESVSKLSGNLTRVGNHLHTANPG
ncbi:MAG: hypothetical protein Q7U98_16235 [Methylicorpusculum sp.]|uniref:hypothetical protein n=1 Tax=Methylicorpusculum sp. TaxID=2713644 RepID=UPI0027203296|nr:hypothetical protein [Methylicorpusculum sp.]MDO8940706.1 hypothetical protein [Methylicorpusculum sp.]MDP2202665.1 hypothetical protein [Methylicorpusculum sp.]